jgi:hypothetical protein
VYLVGKKRKNTPDRDNIQKVQCRLTAMHLQGEIAYIIHRAQEHDSRCVTLGPLVFFSTQSGDAWMLDWEDKLALCLARDAAAQPYRIVETAQSFAVAWDRQFEIDGDVFTTMDKSGQIRSFIGYPTADLLEAIRRGAEMPRPQ